MTNHHLVERGVGVRYVRVLLGQHRPPPLLAASPSAVARRLTAPRRRRPPRLGRSPPVAAEQRAERPAHSFSEVIAIDDRGRPLEIPCEEDTASSSSSSSASEVAAKITRRSKARLWNWTKDASWMMMRQAR